MRPGIPLLLIVIFALSACSRAPEEQTQPALSLQEVAPGIYVHAGRHVPFDHEQADDIANIGFIVGEDCVAVIDTGGSVETGRLLKQSITATTDVPICYVINTHIHYDHLLGNKPFAQPGVKFISPQGLAGALAASKPFFIEDFPHYLGNSGDPAEALIAPDQEVEDSITLNLGEREIALRTWPAAHTNHDLTVYDEQTRTLWASDLLFIDRIPALDASLKGWLAVMDELAEIPAERVVPGHGPAVADWPQALAAQREYLTALLVQTRAAIAEGLFLDEAMNNVASDAAAEWQLSDQHHRRNVSRAYQELEWE